MADDRQENDPTRKGHGEESRQGNLGQEERRAATGAWGPLGFTGNVVLERLLDADEDVWPVTRELVAICTRTFSGPQAMSSVQVAGAVTEAMALLQHTDPVVTRAARDVEEAICDLPLDGESGANAFGVLLVAADTVVRAGAFRRTWG